MWEEKHLKFLLDKKLFPECIECGGKYFHKQSCQRGMGIPWEETNRRLNKRLKELEKKFGHDGCGIQCRQCENHAEGMMQVLFHHTAFVAEEWPVCMDHAFYEDLAGRDSQFVPFK